MDFTKHNGLNPRATIIYIERLTDRGIYQLITHFVLILMMVNHFRLLKNLIHYLKKSPLWTMDLEFLTRPLFGAEFIIVWVF